MEQPFNNRCDGGGSDSKRNDSSETVEERLGRYEKRLKELAEENDRLNLVVHQLRAALAALGGGDPAHGEVDAPAKAVGDSRRSDVEERILQYLAAIGVASTREITSVLGLTRKSAQIHLGELLRAKLVNDCETPRRLSLLEKHRLLEQSSRSWELTNEGRQYIETRELGGIPGRNKVADLARDGG
jgi:hypothetical protein